MNYTKECSVYPGEYTLMPETETLMKELAISRNGLAAKPLVNMEELDDCFKIEMIVPASKREELIVKINKNILSVIVLHKNYKEPDRKLQIHEFDPACTERHILLPANADTEFLSAGYRRGMLSFYIPKNQKASQSDTTRQIVIY